ncbi:hypothetical protein MPTK1_7g18870 [Marchantia polymorpha subsp. ruderalis]|uniref:Uncharacterized protein n=2 Tax=Marchantia polymorpha TaxID=3197 RepID=A0AAF6C183_MARPO|nr:hypothetical protein MARPO_0067s0090 [Marchantia polymorpha]BBN18017.1 hypothetical protein Mp_7g18870 [Marchantia polymorpha subsp. ruderalis]|eukprot:PTQ36018.1 hypothetical protein MARPO_0067s0090 [Marchantia polymorpha]
MFFCFICDQKRRVKSAKPANGLCGNCGGGASDVKVKDTCRFCFIPLCWRTHHTIMCRQCGARLRSH